MPANNVQQLKVWKSAHDWLARVSAAYKARGNSSASMTQIASQVILAIPMPNGNGHQPDAPSLNNPQANTPNQEPGQ